VDISPTIQANSQQINADDFTGSPRTVTITNVEAGTSEQPVFIHVAEFPGRTFRPGKSMRRVLVFAWGPEASNYIGRRLTLFNDPTIRFGKEVTGGVRISHMSNLEKTLTVPLTVTRGKRAPFTVEPLPAEPDPLAQSLDDIARADSIPTLKAAWDLAGTRGIQNHPDVVAAKEARKTDLAKES
jgi:hypothetical protein